MKLNSAWQRLQTGRRGAPDVSSGATTAQQTATLSRWITQLVADAIDATLVVDGVGRICDVNTAATQLLRRARSALIDEQVTTFLPVLAGDGSALLSAPDFVAAYPEMVRLPETTLPPCEGARKPVEVTVWPLHEGYERRFVVTVRDLTTEKRTQANFGDTGPLFRAIAEHGSVGTIVISLEHSDRGRLEFVNQAAANLLGNHPHMLEQQTIDDITFVDDRETILDRVLAAELGNRTQMQLETRLKDHDGEAVWALLSFSSHGPNDGLAKRVAVLQVTDIRERKRFEHELQALADHDSLTGLYNRRRLEEELRRAVAQVSRYGGSGALMMFDVDGFKYVNDTLGHAAGDELLKRVATLLRMTMRETDLLARTGGDEFAAILPATNADSAAAAARKVLQKVSGALSDASGANTAQITVSIGLTAFDQETRLRPEDLMIEADLAMYQAKEAGKDQLAIYARSTDRRAQLSRRESLRSRLRVALEENQFEVLTQPLCRLSDGAPTMTVLAPHVRNPQGELIEPSSFLDDDERTGLRREVDAWSFREALRLLRVNFTQVTGLPIVVKMSLRTLENPMTLGQVGVEIGLSPIARGSLVVELGATPTIHDPDYVANVARGLQKLGCRLAISGFEYVIPSLPFLHDLNFEYIKLNGAIATAAVRNPAAKAVVQMVANIARDSHALAAADGITSPTMATAFAEMGIQIGSGPLFGELQPARVLMPSAY